ncbi:MAG: YmdB family metallophosphoesterase [Thermoguttaceae bacterium]|nr:YmdB family metallophosphoesterase [Thermoguttaceae bacterium]MBR4752618.1 YmdB family metallophosphoesterase [Thermoguttaceae bacterium]
MLKKEKDDRFEKNDSLRVLMVGDVVGKPGRDVVIRRMRDIRETYEIDFVVCNAENAAGGSGITPEIYNAIVQAGVDCVTLGDHAFRQKSFLPVLRSNDQRVVRPANLPSEAPGRGWTILEAPATEKRPAVKIGVAALLGRVFMQTQGDNPLAAADKLLEKFADVRARFLDFHAEATSETQIMGRYLDGRFSAVLGTHTHVATADEQIFPNGTAFQCDVGMTGPFESVIGRKIDSVVENFRTSLPTSFDVASGDARLNGTIVDVDPALGKARAIRRLNFGIDD